MPINKILPSRRAKAAIAAVVAACVGGYATLSGQPVADDVLLASTALVRPWEGRELRAYRDIVGVFTICDGDTENVHMGMVETQAGCDARLQKRLTKDFKPGLQKCIANYDAKPLSWRAMMISLSYNVGTRAACNSRAAAFGNAGKYHDSCIAATAFNKAGGKMIAGLVKRREMGDAQRIGEAELCVSGLD
ncbi:lysozyme [Mesorhizobium sp.]|uniref:lysozyme n=1 Tax=Mesorhizobium sp. TaxID=1871066 RepID=UPI0012261B35|nr:lysozyme [Mesorhizobium sp.]TIN83090.1 MAG: lysozyme [Mesorhizobium sp.]